MNDNPRFIRGTPALLLLVGVGGGSLAASGHHLAQLDPSGTMALFMAGLACGYVPPLALRIGGMIGRQRIEQFRSLRVAFLALYLLPLMAPLIAAAAMMPRAGDVLGFFGGGTLSMWTLGTALLDDRSGGAAA